MNGVAFLLVVLGGINGVNAQRRSQDGAVSFTSEGPGRELVDRGPPGRLRAPRETPRRLAEPDAVARAAFPGDAGAGELGRLRAAYARLLTWSLTGSLQEGDGKNGKRVGGTDWPGHEPFMRSHGLCRIGETMVGRLRMQNIYDAVIDVTSKPVPGDFAELGVWRGGATIFAKALFDMLGETDRRVHVFDAFASMPGYKGNAEFLHNDVEDVRSSFRNYGVLDDRVTWQVGLFKDTVPQFAARCQTDGTKLAVLRIDGNFYDSYQDALYYLYPLVPVGGWVIFDDIRSHPAVARCWQDFQRDQGFSETIIPIDVHSAYFVKTTDVTVDMGKMHAPQDANKI